jgi:hypothetical protein
MDDVGDAEANRNAEKKRATSGSDVCLNGRPFSLTTLPACSDSGTNSPEPEGGGASGATTAACGAKASGGRAAALLIKGGGATAIGPSLRRGESLP